MTNEQKAKQAANPNCKKCKFYDKFGYTGISAGQANNRGICRRNPPSVIDRDERRIWPAASVADWCGEYEEETDGNAGDEEKAAEVNEGAA